MWRMPPQRPAEPGQSVRKPEACATLGRFSLECREFPLPFGEEGGVGGKMDAGPVEGGAEEFGCFAVAAGGGESAGVGEGGLEGLEMGGAEMAGGLPGRFGEGGEGGVLCGAGDVVADTGGAGVPEFGVAGIEVAFEERQAAFIEPAGFVMAAEAMLDAGEGPECLGEQSGVGGFQLFGDGDGAAGGSGGIVDAALIGIEHGDLAEGPDVHEVVAGFGRGGEKGGGAVEKVAGPGGVGFAFGDGGVEEKAGEEIGRGRGRRSVEKGESGFVLGEGGGGVAHAAEGVAEGVAGAGFGDGVVAEFGGKVAGEVGDGLVQRVATGLPYSGLEAVMRREKPPKRFSAIRLSRWARCSERWMR